MIRSGGRFLGLVVLAGMVSTSACAPQARVAQPAEPTPSVAPARAPTQLTVAIQLEPRGFLTSGLGGLRGGSANVLQMVHEYLVMPDEKGAYLPKLAAEPPSVDRGTWRVNPDGSMDTIWKLKPNAKWHDGTPFTADDMLLTYDVYMDPASSIPGTTRAFLISASAPDPYTFVLRYSTVIARAAYADVAFSSVMPKHLLGELFARGDRAAFESSPLLTTEFVGLGAYRLVSWERGSHLELAAFDDYYAGRPRIDRITVRFISDPNTMVSNILSGAVDVILPVGVDLDSAIEVKRRWQGTANQVRVDPTSTLVHLLIQFRPDLARPSRGLADRTVRQALYQAIDRQLLVDSMMYGLAPAADSWITPTSPLRPELASSIPPLPYDPARAEALLGEAGWARGPDGVLFHGQTGEPLRLELWGNQGLGSATERQLSVIADGWKGRGAQVELNIVPAGRVNDNEYQSQFPGAFLYTSIARKFVEDNLHSRQIPTAERRWAGFNRGGYSIPALDTLLDRLQATIDPREQLSLHRQLLQLQMGEVAIMPLYWEVAPVLMVQGVRVAPAGEFATTAWDIMQWHKE